MVEMISHYGIQHGIAKVFKTFVIKRLIIGETVGRLMRNCKVKQAKIPWPVIQHLPKRLVMTALCGKMSLKKQYQAQLIH